MRQPIATIIAGITPAIRITTVSIVAIVATILATTIIMAFVPAVITITTGATGPIILPPGTGISTIVQTGLTIPEETTIAMAATPALVTIMKPVPDVHPVPADPREPIHRAIPAATKTGQVHLVV